MKVLITGGAGFIGSHLAEELLKRGEEVYVIDNLSTGNLKNIEHLIKKSSFHHTIDSIMNVEVMDELISRCECIYHLAAAVGVKLIMSNPVDTIETNIHGTDIVMKLANRYKRKVLIASSSEVYGKTLNDRNPVNKLSEEADMTIGPTSKRRWAYACTKIIDEFLALAYYEEKKCPVVIARLFNTVGPRQTGRYGMVLPNFVQRALLNKPITIYGDGKQKRSFTYVTDVVRAMIGLMEHPDAVGEVFNIGHGKEITIEDLARKVIRLTNSKSEIEYIPYERIYGKGFEDMDRRCPDISKIERLIGYRPTLDLDEIIMKVIEYFKG